MGAMRKRIVVGAALIAFAVGLLWLDARLERAQLPRLGTDASGRGMILRGLPLAALMVVLIPAGFLELSRMAAAAGAGVLRITGLGCAVLVGTLPCWREALPGAARPRGLMGLVLAGTALAVFVEQLGRYRTREVIRRVGGTLLAVCYLGVCAAVLLELRLRFGVKALVLFLAAVKFTDIGAYFAGTAWGRHKMIPWLSPGKSWEGLAGGLVLAAATGAALAAALNPVLVRTDASGVPAAVAGMSPWVAAGLAVVIGLFGQAADLCESAMKRDAGAKDAGASVPGFGGVLDVLDSPLLAAPAGYVLLAVVA